MQENYFDSHVHSHNSFDGADDVSGLCRAAVRAGLTGISITDHCDFGHYMMPDWKERLKNSAFDTERAKREFSGKLTVTFGVELGQPLEDLETALEAMRACRYDFVLCSVHNIPGLEDFSRMSLKNTDNVRLMRRYLEELYELAKWGSFDVLGHITYPLRYIARCGGTLPDMRRFEEELRLVFTELSKRGKGIELNTSELSGDLGRTMPELWELGLFRECGGEIVTVGSDAHRAEDVGSGISAGLALLKAAGFSHQAFYKRRTPVMIQLF